jgi:anti-anti-sigma regulatory factor
VSHTIPAEAALAAILDGAPVALLGLDASGVVREAAGAIVAGLKLVGVHLVDLAEDRAAAAALLAQAAAGPATGRIRIADEHSLYVIEPTTGALLRSDTRPGQRWWNLALRPEAGGTLIVATDVTERVDAELGQEALLAGVRCILWHATVRADGEAVRWDFRLANPTTACTLVPLNVEPGSTWGASWVRSRNPEDAAVMNQNAAAALRDGRDGYTQMFRCTVADGSVRWFSEDVQITQVSPGHWELTGLCTDVTEQRRADERLRELEEAQIAAQQQLIDAQRAALREISTPLVPIAAEVIAMPLVGAIDEARAQQVMETLLEGIVAFQAGTAILDITGVRVVDTQVASALLRVAQAAQLLGTRVVLTGISAEVAQSLVTLGAELRGIAIHRNLQSAIAEVLH